MSTTATRAPSSAKRWAVARPMPEAAPVTSATLPSTDRDSAVSRAMSHAPAIDAVHPVRLQVHRTGHLHGHEPGTRRTVRAAGGERVQVVVEHPGPQTPLRLGIVVRRRGPPHLEAVALLRHLPVQ